VSLPYYGRISSHYLKTAIAQAEAALSTEAKPLWFYQNVAPSKELRDASKQAESISQEYDVEMGMRTDIFKVVEDTAARILASGERLAPEDQRFVDKVVLEGKRNGLALSNDQQRVFKILKEELNKVMIEFNQNFNEENGHVSFSLADLDGIPHDVVNGYPKREGDDGKDIYHVPFKTTDIFPVLKFAKSSNTRQLTWEAFESRLAHNTPLLDRAIEVRHKIAAMLGYVSWADYRAEPKMVHTGKNIADVSSSHTILISSAKGNLCSSWMT
jgi:Zn-dependent oligopeptidase